MEFEREGRIMNNKSLINSFVAAGGFIPWAYNHVKKYPSLDNRTKEVLLDEVTNYLKGFDIVLSEVEVTHRDEFRSYFEEELAIASQLKAALSLSNQ